MTAILGWVTQTSGQLDQDSFARWVNAVAARFDLSSVHWSNESAGLAECRRPADRGHGALSVAKSASGVRGVSDARLDETTSLRRSLDASGFGLSKQAGDAAAILSAYDAWGARLVERLRGDFSFILWDAAGGRLVAARDYFGVRPLYYARSAGGLLVSSCAHALFMHPHVAGALDDASVVRYLVSGRVDAEATLFRAIRRVPPGGLLSFRGDALRVEQYPFPLAVEPLRYRDDRQYAEHFREVVAAAVGDRVRGGPASVWMSGGIDSTMIAAVAAADAGTEQIRAYTAGFRNLMVELEAPRARGAATHLGIQHELFLMDDSPLLGAADAVDLASVLPVETLFTTAGLEMTRRMSRHSRTALSGLGPDALLSTDPLVTALAHAPVSSWIPLVSRVARHAIHRRTTPALGVRGPLRRMMALPDRASVPKWLRPEMAVHVTPAATPVPDRVSSSYGPPLSRAYWSDTFQTYDAFASPHGVTTAHPYFDLRVVAFCLAVPYDQRFDKLVARRAAAGWLPRDVTGRRKTPLSGSPLAEVIARGLNWLPREQPGEEIRRFCVFSSFAEFGNMLDADGAHTIRPVALDRFLRAWQSQPLAH